MFHEVKDKVYPSLLVTHIEIFKSSILKDFIEKHQFYLESIQKDKGKGDQNNYVWFQARNLIWTYTAFGIRFMLKEKPTESLKFFNQAAKMMEKTPIENCLWEGKDDWKVLKIVLYRNMAFFYSKFKDIKVAIKYLSIVLEVQSTLQKNMRDKIDTETPKMALSYFLFLEKQYTRASQIARVVLNEYENNQKEGLSDFLEPTLYTKNKNVHLMICYIVEAKSILILKRDLRLVTELYRKGMLYVKRVIEYFGQDFKNIMLDEYQSLKKQFEREENQRKYVIKQKIKQEKELRKEEFLKSAVLTKPIHEIENKNRSVSPENGGGNSRTTPTAEKPKSSQDSKRLPSTTAMKQSKFAGLMASRPFLEVNGRPSIDMGKPSPPPSTKHKKSPSLSLNRKHFFPASDQDEYTSLEQQSPLIKEPSITNEKVLSLKPALLDHNPEQKSSKRNLFKRAASMQPQGPQGGGNVGGKRPSPVQTNMGRKSMMEVKRNSRTNLAFPSIEDQIKLEGSSPGLKTPSRESISSFSFQKNELKSPGLKKLLETPTFRIKKMNSRTSVSKLGPLSKDTDQIEFNSEKEIDSVAKREIKKSYKTLQSNSSDVDSIVLSSDARQQGFSQHDQQSSLHLTDKEFQEELEEDEQSMTERSSSRLLNAILNVDENVFEKNDTQDLVDVVHLLETDPLSSQRNKQIVTSSRNESFKLSSLDDGDISSIYPDDYDGQILRNSGTNSLIEIEKSLSIQNDSNLIKNKLSSGTTIGVVAGTKQVLEGQGATLGVGTKDLNNYKLSVNDISQPAGSPNKKKSFFAESKNFLSPESIYETRNQLGIPDEGILKDGEIISAAGASRRGSRIFLNSSPEKSQSYQSPSQTSPPQQFQSTFDELEKAYNNNMNKIKKSTNYFDNPIRISEVDDESDKKTGEGGTIPSQHTPPSQLSQSQVSPQNLGISNKPSIDLESKSISEFGNTNTNTNNQLNVSSKIDLSPNNMFNRGQSGSLLVLQNTSFRHGSMINQMGQDPVPSYTYGAHGHFKSPDQTSTFFSNNQSRVNQSLSQMASELNLNKSESSNSSIMKKSRVNDSRGALANERSPTNKRFQPKGTPMIQRQGTQKFQFDKPPPPTKNVRSPDKMDKKFAEMAMPTKYGNFEFYKNVPIEFYYSYQFKLHTWSLQYKKKALDSKQTFQLYFGLYCDYSKAYLPIQFEYKPLQNKLVKLPDPLPFITIWPIVIDFFEEWFKKLGIDDSYNKFCVTYLKQYPKNIIMKEKISISKGEMTKVDQEAIRNINKRMMYLIDRRLLLVRKPSGRIFELSTDQDSEQYKMWILTQMLEKVQQMEEESQNKIVYSQLEKDETLGRFVEKMYKRNSKNGGGFISICY